MNLRDALIQQSPSLSLQRAAADEIARLDAELDAKQAMIDRLLQKLNISATGSEEFADRDLQSRALIDA